MSPTVTRAVIGSARPALVDVQVRQIAADERDCAQAMISAVLARHRGAADYAHLRLSASAQPDGPVLAQVNLRVCGAPARIQVAGGSAAQAIAAAATRLERQIRRLSTVWEPWPWPDPERSPLASPQPGVITRRKTYGLRVGVPCRAAAVLNAMDYDVHLYTDADTGEDAVVFRSGATGLRLARQRTMRPPTMSSGLPLTINSREIPVLSAAEATTYLAEYWLPWVFFTDRDTGRGNLLYRRYDGDLGLIAPPQTQSPRGFLPLV